MKAKLLIFFLVTGIPAGVHFKQRHDLEERAITAACTLHENARRVLRGSRLLPE